MWVRKRVNMGWSATQLGRATRDGCFAVVVRFAVQSVEWGLTETGWDFTAVECKPPGGSAQRYDHHPDASTPRRLVSQTYGDARYKASRLHLATPAGLRQP